ncbi:hypothetical protein RF11_08802 [Thelohanellus kitauei]|uniref:Uncharacterized protein n=1 Tax=Thelohanellus kitauei TaxID=669202 RepID=A0A0C2MQQ7_THEKT|nr:hypothetical protein RF11_08802 [Thelohanellus kitauei]
MDQHAKFLVDTFGYSVGHFINKTDLYNQSQPVASLIDWVTLHSPFKQSLTIFQGLIWIGLTLLDVSDTPPSLIFLKYTIKYFFGEKLNYHPTLLQNLVLQP